MRKFIITLITVSIALIAGSGQAREGVYRSYLKTGYLATAPTAEDLGYAEVGGASLEEYIAVDKNNFGFGGQFLFDVKKTPGGTYRFGVDFGFQKISSSKFSTGTTDLSFINVDYDEDMEYDLYLLGVTEYAPDNVPFFVQAGLGAHIVYWLWESNFEGKYSIGYDYNSGTEVNLGLLLAGGTRLQITPKVSIPIMARVDSVIRYGTETTVSLVVGLDYNFGN